MTKSGYIFFNTKGHRLTLYLWEIWGAAQPFWAQWVCPAFGTLGYKLGSWLIVCQWDCSFCRVSSSQFGCAVPWKDKNKNKVIKNKSFRRFKGVFSFQLYKTSCCWKSQQSRHRERVTEKKGRGKPLCAQTQTRGVGVCVGGCYTVILLFCGKQTQKHH